MQMREKIGPKRRGRHRYGGFGALTEEVRAQMKLSLVTPLAEAGTRVRQALRLEPDVPVRVSWIL